MPFSAIPRAILIRVSLDANSMNADMLIVRSLLYVVMAYTHNTTNIDSINHHPPTITTNNSIQQHQNNSSQQSIKSQGNNTLLSGEKMYC